MSKDVKVITFTDRPTGKTITITKILSHIHVDDRNDGDILVTTYHFTDGSTLEIESRPLDNEHTSRDVRMGWIAEP